MKKYMTVPIELLPHYEGLQRPEYAHAGDSGFDLRAAVLEDAVVAPGERALVPCGFRLAVDRGYELQIRPRSGLAWKQGVTVLNSPGTIDSSYRGEVHALVVNLGSEDLIIKRGDRIAQAVVAPVVVAHFDFVDTLDDTVRGSGGFGSTGKD